MALTRTGPVTTDPSAVALGLAQIRVGVAATHIASADAELVAADSIGALSTTKFAGKTDYWKLESGFPLLEDLTIPLRESAALECGIKQFSLSNLLLARGIDPNKTYVAPAVAPTSIALGSMKAPDYIRMEAVYTFPDLLHQMVIIFPRANVVSSLDFDLKIEDAAIVPITFQAKRADSGLASGGNALWDNQPLGTIIFLTGADMV